MTRLAARGRLIWLASITPVLLGPAGISAAAVEPLYPVQGIQAEAVKQGNMGSCYFHSTIAALARVEPERLARSIREDGANYIVRFADGRTEVVRPEDVAYARDNGYDKSDGLWVAVLFRAYAQRVLRESLVRAISAGSSNLVDKLEFEQLAEASDVPLLAYDRAIRSQIDQNGTVSAASLRSQLHRQLSSTPLPDSAKAVVEEIMTASGVLDSISTMLRENGELFGSYRAAGHGGLPEGVFKAFSGSGRSLQKASAAQVILELRAARLRGRAVVASTSQATLEDLKGELKKQGASFPADAAAWYIPLHAYTVLEFDGNNVTLRNPWGNHPLDSQGIFKLSVDDFAVLFPYLFLEE